MDSGPDRTDRELWIAGRNDPRVFGQLFERHGRAVFTYCARCTADLGQADDLTNIVFLEAWRRRYSVTLTNDSALPWLLGTAHNMARNSQRGLRRYRRALSRLPPPEFEEGVEEGAIERVDAERALADAQREIEALPEVERDVVLMVLWSGLSYEHAAAALGVPVGTVRSRLARARAKLGSALTDDRDAASHGVNQPEPQSP